MMKTKKSLFLILLFLLTGCVHHETNVMIRPSDVPAKVMTKTAIPPVTLPKAVSPAGNDPWELCESQTESDPVLLRVSELGSEEFRRRVRISFMIQNEEAETALIAQRCMNGKVYVCYAEEGVNCHDKLDFSVEPNETMLTVCAYPELDGGILTSVVLGRNTPFQWVCRDGIPVISKVIAEADAAGYDKAVWTEIPKPE